MKPKNLLSKEYLVEKYLNQKLSMKDIAIENNCGQSTISYYLKKYELNTRKNQLNLVGEKFGRGKVLSLYSNSGSPNWTIKWKVVCDCGNLYYPTTGSLRCGNTLSCGCLQSEAAKMINWKGYKEIPYSYWGDIIEKANIRKLEIDISIEYAWEIMEKQNFLCNLSGKKLYFTKYKKRGNASLDRIDSSKGYLKNNIQWIHKDINRIKSNLKEEYFLKLCQEITEWKNK